jgi:hypothetical protein
MSINKNNKKGLQKSYVKFYLFIYFALKRVCYWGHLIWGVEAPKLVGEGHGSRLSHAHNDVGGHSFYEIELAI